MTFFKNSNLLKNKKRQKVKMFKLFLLNPDKWTFLQILVWQTRRACGKNELANVSHFFPFESNVETFFFLHNIFPLDIMMQ